MNDRVRELAKEAGAMFDHMTWVERDLAPVFDRFAELIVRECIDIVSPYAIRMENFDGGHPIADLKKHFGVEE